MILGKIVPNCCKGSIRPRPWVSLISGPMPLLAGVHEGGCWAWVWFSCCHFSAASWAVDGKCFTQLCLGSLLVSWGCGEAHLQCLGDKKSHRSFAAWPPPTWRWSSDQKRSHHPGPEQQCLGLCLSVRWEKPLGLDTFPFSHPQKVSEPGRWHAQLSLL